MIRVVFIVTVAARLFAFLQEARGAETLSAAWQQALASNGQLAASQLEHDATRSEWVAASAERLPRVWTQTSYQLRSDERSFQFANPLAPSQQFITPYAQREAALSTLGVTAPIYTAGEIDSA